MFLDSADQFSSHRIRSGQESNASKQKSSKTYYMTNNANQPDKAFDSTQQIKSNISKKLIKHFLQ